LTSEQIDFPRLSLIVRARQFVDYFFCLGYGMIGLQIVLELAGAHNDCGFKRFLNRITYPLLGPFEGMFPDPVFDNRFHVRISYCVALMIYSLIHLAVFYFLRLLRPRRQLL
jgi:YggT family protein